MDKIITAVRGCIFLFQAVMALAGHYAPTQAFPLLVARHLLLAPAGIFTFWFQRWYPAYGSVKGG